MLGVGTDIVEIYRIKRIYSKYPKAFAQKILAQEELEVFNAHPRKLEYLAGRFAAKEAILKALGTGLRNCSWSEIAVLNNKLGKPCVHIKGNLLTLANDKEIKKIHVSISHSKEYAVGFCIIE